MNSYLTIQYKRFCRASYAKGIHPIASVLLIIVLFLGASELVFLRIPFAAYVYSGFGILSVIAISQRNRIEFLKQCFRPGKLKKILLTEKLMIMLPFISFLFYKAQFIHGISLIAIPLVFTVAPIRLNTAFTIPTPFSRWPFEFTVGFRRVILLFFGAYLITYFAVESNNYKLGLFILLITFLINAMLHSKAEPLYYLWIYKHAPRQFLLHKLKIILGYAILPALPILITLLYFYPSLFWLSTLGLLTGIAYVTTFMFAKYASYPFEISITDSFITAGCVLFPPIMLLALPYFYIRSVKTLNSILHD